MEKLRLGLGCGGIGAAPVRIEGVDGESLFESAVAGRAVKMSEVESGRICEYQDQIAAPGIG